MIRCDDVLRELAAPSDDRESAVLEAHLADCPSCAAWAERNSRLDRLWEATRPAPPSAAAWDAVWAGVLDRLDAPAAPRLLPATASSPWRRRGRIALGLAQAAAIVSMAVLLVRSAPMPRGLGTGPVTLAVADATRPADARSPVEVEIDAGQLIRLTQGPEDGDSIRVVAVATDDDRTDALDDGFVMLGAFESLAQGGTDHW